MIHLLNLLAAIALLVWGTHIVRTGMLRVFGENLRQVLARSFSSRFTAALAGVGVTSLVQSSTATCLIVASFVGQGLVGPVPALAVMLGAAYLRVGESHIDNDQTALGRGRVAGVYDARVWILGAQYSMAF